MLNKEQIGLEMLTELSNEARTARGDLGGETGLLHTRDTLGQETLMQLPRGLRRDLENGHTLAVDYRGNLALSANPTAEIQPSRSTNARLERDSEIIAMRRLMRGWGLDDSVLLSKRIPEGAEGVIPLIIDSNPGAESDAAG